MIYMPIDTPGIDANRAREMTIHNLAKRTGVYELLDEIYNVIIEAANAGEYCCRYSYTKIDQSVLRAAMAILRMQGYVVRDKFNPLAVDIYWE